MSEGPSRWLREARAAREAGRLPEASGLYRRILEEEPAHAEANAELADALHALGDLASAIGHYRAAVAADPSGAGPWWGLGCALAALDDHAGAVEAFRKLAALAPGHGQTLHNLGRSLYELGRVDEALGCFERAAALLPADAACLPLTNQAMIVPGAPGAGTAAILDCRRRWAARCLPAATPPAARRPATVPVATGRRVRIGYVSASFDKRNWMKPVHGMLAHHDRGRFEVHLFSDGPAPPPGTGHRPHPDDRWHATGELSNADLAGRIASDGIDVLVDLNGFGRPSRLGVFAARPAPVQVTWFNSYATSGTDAFDALIGDRHVLPPGHPEEAACSERVLRVPGSYLAFDVAYEVPDVAPPPCLASGFLTFGCLAPQYKVTGEVLEAWSRILARSPRSRLLLKSVVLGKPAARDLVAGEFARRGIAADRLILEGPDEHFAFLGRYAAVDVALDTFPYNGGTTTMEALWQGVPVLCFEGDRWASRISASLVREAGLGEFVARDLEGHVDQAVGMALDPGTPSRLDTLRRSLRDRLRASSACDVAGLARGLERIYLDLLAVR
ncbi:Tetratricopeptide repeat protein [Aquisphaera giovannonii]|uniref:protein O-GlcNAc transferase n=1 Tax=Aquisphaera giovannonii TaxID=406548 RepID=A0A5B9VY76_9BACT|nr:glycosyltransferase family 41 protein [Aquisphaera giovannonii]QEH32570.1 Tetratricopeptide repeat protein [Aquisphaera giovannonii]